MGSRDAGPADAASEAPVDADTAPPMPMPLVTDLGGPKLTAVRVVTVSFSNDDPNLVASLQSFDDAITSTAWWSAVASEYGVGAGAGGGHVVLPMAASSAYTDSVRGGDSSVRQLIQSSVASGALPAPDAQTLYVLFFPSGSILRLDGISACAPPGGTGWHDAVTVTPPEAGPAVDVAYAVLPRCQSDLAAMTLAASHEIVESATDPSPENAPAVQMTDPAWLAFGPEVADVCIAVDTNLTTTDSGFSVQRSWSNASAKAGHDPCVPTLAGTAYFNVAPATGTEELTLAVGESASFALYAESDADAGPWQVQPVVTNGSSSLGVTVDRSTVRAGDHAIATVTLQSPPTLGATELYGFVSEANGATYVRPMLVQAR
ncbi:MAG TPA: hypothetical protein VMI75_04260 [Polyangiaceae bacterium]|nr:hypothetical protein [Polyangiaceae bacterium]